MSLQVSQCRQCARLSTGTVLAAWLHTIFLVKFSSDLWLISKCHSIWIIHSEYCIKILPGIKHQQIISISPYSENVSKLLQPDLLASPCFDCNWHANLLAVSYSQAAILIVPTTKHHAVLEEEERCHVSAPNLQQTQDYVWSDKVLPITLYCVISGYHAIIDFITLQWGLSHHLRSKGIALMIVWTVTGIYHKLAVTSED